MAKIQIVTDTTTSLSQKECDDLGIDCVQTSYVLDDEEHLAFDNEEITLPEFYQKLDEVKFCSTGCVNTQTFEECFEKYTSKGIQVVYIGLSSALSATSENAISVAEKLAEKYGKKMVSVIDTRQAGASYGSLILIEEAIQLVDEGKSLEEIEEIINKKSANMSLSFVARDLNFLHKCGRLSTVGAVIGKMLKVVPLIYADKETGKLKVGDKCLGTKLAFKTLKNKFVNLIKEKRYTKAYITSCALDAEVEELKKYILENTQGVEVKTGYIDKTLSCCCGPKTIAIFCG